MEKRIGKIIAFSLVLGVTICGYACEPLPSSNSDSSPSSVASDSSDSVTIQPPKAEENYTTVDGNDDTVYITDNNDIQIEWDTAIAITQVKADDIVLSPENYLLKDESFRLYTSYLDTVEKGRVIKLTLSTTQNDFVYDLVRPTAVISNLNEISEPNGYYILDGDIDAYAVNDDAYARFRWCRFLTLSNGTNYSWYERDGDDGEKTTYQNEGFNGTLDGRGYTIKNITNVSYGLFAIVGKNGVIKNVHFEDFKGEDGWEQPVVAAQFYGTLKNVSFYSANKSWAIIGIAGAGARFINVVAYASNASVASLYTQVNLRENTTFKNVYVVSNQSLGTVCFDETIDGYDIHTFNAEGYKYKLDPNFRAVDFSEIFDCSFEGRWIMHETGLPFIG